jgi:hypothetical protein
VVNAVYHRSYEIREPIEVRVLPDSITVVSYPGPDRSIRLEDLETGYFAARRFNEEGKVILCTHGFLKRSRKTPDREIYRADLLRKSYLETKAKGPLMIIEREKKVIP